MAYEISNYSVKVTLVAAADLSAKQYQFVKLDSAGKAVVVAANTDRPIGVLQNAPLEGQEAEVLVVGGTKLVAGEAVTEGAVISTTSAGKADSIAVGSATTQYILGTALTEVAADGEIFTAVINCASSGRAA
jgi:hypothetical protein